jgi:hypothetical protein
MMIISTPLTVKVFASIAEIGPISRIPGCTNFGTGQLSTFGEQFQADV